MHRADAPSRQAARRKSQRYKKLRSNTRRRRGSRRGRRFEPLESRLLLASDLALTDAPLEAAPAAAVGDVAPAWEAAAPTTQSAATSDTQGAGEGEAAAVADLPALAQALRDAGVKLYGAAGSAATTDQKALFEDGAQLLPYIEAANPDGTPNQIALDEQIAMLPTWELANRARQEGVQTIAALSQWSGVPVPVSDQPFIAPLPDVTLRSGSPLHIPLDGYDPNGQPLTYTVESSDPLIAASLLEGNASWRISVDSYGDLVAELFDGRAPRATERIKELTNAGFYDGLTFHRVMDGFVVQGGDPNGDGTGGSSLPDFDNQFAPDAQHNRSGMFSFANRGDNTNNSQFFIADLDPAANPDSERSLRYLDFNHPVFAVLVEGYDVLDALTRVPTTPDSPAPPPNNAPLDDLVIDSAEIFTDQENAVALLAAVEGLSGEADITVTATDSDGNQFQQTFHVTVIPDTFNGSPFLLDLPPLRTHRNEPITVTLQAQDVEGDKLVFSGSNPTSVDYTGSMDGETGELTIVPPEDFVGVLEVDVAVQQETPADANDPIDRRRLSIEVAPESPTGIDLLPASDSGADNADDLTNQTVLQVDVTGVSPGATVSLHDGDGTLLGQAAASADHVVITTSDLSLLGDGPVALIAVQTVNGVASDPSASLTVTLDTQIPPFTTTPPSEAPMNAVLTYDIDNPEEGQPGFSYSLIEGPAGAWLDAPTGLLTWVPTASQTGLNAFLIRANDAAGNSISQPIDVEVTGDVSVRFHMETTDLNGAPVSSVDVGEDFLLRVFVEDARPSPEGVFAAYLDVIFQNNLVSVLGAIEFSSSYHVAAEADTSTSGLINEAGAAANKLSPLGPGEFLVFTARLRATAAGDEMFVGDAPDESPQHDVLLFGQMQATPSRVIDFGEAEIHIDPDFGANNDVFGVDEDAAGVVFEVLANDEVFEGSSGQLTIVDVGPLDHGGAVAIADDGKSLLYWPALDFFGEETFTYTVSDGAGADSAAVNVQVFSVNDDPTAVDDAPSVKEDSSENQLFLLSNDNFGPDAGAPFESLVIIDVAPTSQGGSVALGPNGLFVVYTPPPDFSGVDTFTYTIADRSGPDQDNALTAQANVSVAVEPENDDPRARDDALSVNEDSSDNVLDLLANDDSGPDGSETLTIEQVGASAAGGVVSIRDDGARVAYTPPSDFFGEDRFTYSISDGNGGTDEASVTVSVLAQNDPPTADDDHFTVIQGAGTQTLNVLLNDSAEPDQGETLTVAAVSDAAHGSVLAIAPDGDAVQFTPAAGFVGTETFTYTLRDSHGAEAEASVSVEVLDYVPRRLSGKAASGGAQHPFGGVPVTLRGTDLFGNPVERNKITDAGGAYHFDDLPPGQYTISQDPLMFLVGGDNQVSVTSEVDDGDSEGNNFAPWSRRAEYISLLDFLAPKPEASILAAVSRSEGQLWYCVEHGWNGFSDVQMQLSEDSSSLQLTVVDSQLHRLSTVVPLRDPMRVDLLAHEGDAWLVRLRGDSAAFDFHAVADGAEGEPTGAPQPAAVASLTTAAPATFDPGPADPGTANPEPPAPIETPAAGEPAGRLDPQPAPPAGEGEAPPQSAAIAASGQPTADSIVTASSPSPASPENEPASPSVINAAANTPSTPSEISAPKWLDIAIPARTPTAPTTPFSLLPAGGQGAAATDEVEAAVDFILADRDDEPALAGSQLAPDVAGIEPDVADYAQAVDILLAEQIALLEDL